MKWKRGRRRCGSASTPSLSWFVVRYVGCERESGCGLAGWLAAWLLGDGPPVPKSRIWNMPVQCSAVQVRSWLWLYEVGRGSQCGSVAVW